MHTSNDHTVPRELQLQAAVFRLGNVNQEIEAGYRILRRHHKTVTVFGSARVSETDRYYQQARQLGGSSLRLATL